MSFQQGLSGLGASSKQLEVIGNNVANSNTVGFKQSRAEFADVFASASGSGNQVGAGVALAAVTQQFSQGNITSTSNTLDVAINGNGFFRMSSNGNISFTRNGQFQMDKSGYIVSSDGKRLMGNAANDLNGATPVEIQIDTSDLPPKASSTVSGTMNFNASAKVIDQTITPFSKDDPLSYTNTTATNVYDSLGNSHNIQSYFVKTADNTWSVYTTIDGNDVTPATPPEIVFTSTGVYDKLNSTANAVTWNPSNGADNMSIAIDYTSSSQFGNAYSINKISQDGYASGRIANVNIGDDGIIMGRYTNGQAKALGRVTLSSFPNSNGLVNQGGNNWTPSSAAGEEVIGAPGSSTLGMLQSSAVEDSNVDLTAELVNMITAQRAYQANAQTIKTQDQLMQTMINMR